MASLPDPVQPRSLDLTAWRRRDHFRLFRAYDHPFFNLCAAVDVAAPLARARAGGPSFSALTLHAAVGAANEIEPFRYRLRGEGVVVHPTVHGGSTVLRSDQTFGFAYVGWDPDPERFARAWREAIAEADGPAGLDPRDDRDDLVHCTVIPWVAFTSMAHARRHDPADSVPKLAFGRFHGAEGRERLPVSVEVHHALMDALEVGRWLEAFERRLSVGPP